MAKVAVVYFSGYGHTKVIAETFANEIAAQLIAIDQNGDILRADSRYNFDPYDKVFVLAERGEFNANHIKFLRLMISSEPRILAKINGAQQILSEISVILASLSGR